MSNTLRWVTDTIKALSDPIRLRTVWVLSEANTRLCVCEIVDSLAESQYNVSRHLRILRNAGLVAEEREGRWVFYSLVAPRSQFGRMLLQAVASLPPELLSHDRRRLKKRLSLRRRGQCVVGMSSQEWRRVSREPGREGVNQRKSP